MNPINGFARLYHLKSVDHGKIMYFNSLNIRAIFDILMKYYVH
jgi:hypothetical protein